jgi:hypothetical protein
LGQKVLSTAVGNNPSVLSYASNAIGAGEGDPASEQASQLAQRVDQARIFALQNAIFDAGSAPVVERDS